jgi:hypothetical protein
MSNTCDCPNPPGGKVTCSDDQLAVCGYLNGQIVSGCFDPPKEAAVIGDKRERNRAVANWALSIIVGRVRRKDELLSPDFVKMLKSGAYEREGTQEVIRFTLPKNLELIADREKPTDYRTI